MYVVPIVQVGSGRLNASFGTGRQHAPPKSSRAFTTEAVKSTTGREVLVQGVIHVRPTSDQLQAHTPDALSCQPPKPSLMPWLRQVAGLTRPADQPRLPAVATRCSPPDSSVSVLSPAHSTSSSSNISTSTAWGTGRDGADPLVIHLPGADGTSESSPADPATAGLPYTPTMVSHSNSLALREPAAVQHRQQGELVFRASSGSRTLPSMLREEHSALQARAAASTPAAVAGKPGGLQTKAPGPFSFLQLQQWGNSNTHWGSPIGGTLYINPPLEPEPVPTSTPTARSSQRQSKGSSMPYWGSPIGGTLYINPPVDQVPAATAAQQQQASSNRASGTCYLGSPIGGTLDINPPVDDLPSPPTPQAAPSKSAVSSSSSSSSWGSWGSPIGGTLYINPQLHDPALIYADTPNGARPAAGSAAPAAVSVAAASTGASSSRGQTSKLPFLPPFQWGSLGPSKAVWGSPIGGTMYINPQAPADWHDGSWGSGGSGFFGSSGGSSGGGGGSSSCSGGKGSGSAAGSSGNAGGGVGGKAQGPAYASARAAAASWGAVPPGQGLVKLGVGLMAALAAAALALSLKAVPAGSPSRSSSGAGSSEQVVRQEGTAERQAAAAAGVVTPAEGGGAVDGAAAEGLGYHQWMVERLQSTLESFEAEQALLRTELAVLSSIPASAALGSNVLAGLRRWLGGSSSSSSSSSDEAGVAAARPEAAAAPDAAAAAGVATQVASLSAADVAARVAEIREQLDSIDVLKAALGAEMAEQQQLLQKAAQEQQEAQQQLTALAAR